MDGRRGRPPKGAKHARKVDGSELAKERLEVILETLTGTLSVEDACAQLGIGAAQFHRLRDRALSGAAEALEPKPSGRRASEPDPEQSRIDELEQELDEAYLELETSRVREELALILPDVLKEEDAIEKKRSATRKTRRTATKRQRKARRKGRRK